LGSDAGITSAVRAVRAEPGEIAWALAMPVSGKTRLLGGTYDGLYNMSGNGGSLRNRSDQPAKLIQLGKPDFGEYTFHVYPSA